MKNNKTKAEQVAELVGKDIATYDGCCDIVPQFMVNTEGSYAYIDLDDNPNTAEQIANALRVLAGEVVE